MHTADQQYPVPMKIPSYGPTIKSVNNAVHKCIKTLTMIVKTSHENTRDGSNCALGISVIPPRTRNPISWGNNMFLAYAHRMSVYAPSKDRLLYQTHVGNPLLSRALLVQCPSHC